MDFSYRHKTFGTSGFVTSSSFNSSRFIPRDGIAETMAFLRDLDGLGEEDEDSEERDLPRYSSSS